MTAGPASPEVLIIVDEVQIRRLLRVTLEAAGYRVRDAANGALGLNEAAVARPDAVILDLSLPDLSGLAVLRQVQALEAELEAEVIHRSRRAVAA